MWNIYAQCEGKQIKYIFLQMIVGVILIKLYK